MNRIEEYFNKCNEMFNVVNTSYPINRVLWDRYRIDTPFDFLENESELSLYIHIPFCSKICSFCEYVTNRFDEDLSTKYVDVLLNEIDKTIDRIRDKELLGLDIGGGTPLVLSEYNLNRIFNSISRLDRSSLITSIETTPEIAANQIDKLKLVSDAGFNRISMGVQTNSSHLQNVTNRNLDSKLVETAVENISKHFKIFNVDLMYGLPSQNVEDMASTIVDLINLDIPQITLYEMRYGMTNLKNSHNKNVLYEMYSIAYNLLIEHGYKSKFGQNTFSKFDDFGVSSYIGSRVLKGSSYIGLGAGAQSLSKSHLSYNIGKNNRSVVDWINNPTGFDDFYKLSKPELVAKHIAISMYFGRFNIKEIENRFDINLFKIFDVELMFLLMNEYLYRDGDEYVVTELGFKNYYGIVGLFYSIQHKLFILS